MEQKTNRELLQDIDNIIKQWQGTDTNRDTRTAIYTTGDIVNNLISIVKNQQQEIESLDKRIAEMELRDKLGQ